MSSSVSALAVVVVRRAMASRPDPTRGTVSCAGFAGGTERGLSVTPCPDNHHPQHYEVVEKGSSARPGHVRGLTWRKTRRPPPRRTGNPPRARTAESASSGSPHGDTEVSRV